MRMSRHLGGLVMTAIVAIAGCGTVASPAPSAAPSTVPSVSPSPSPPAPTPTIAPTASVSVFPSSPVVGIVTKVDAESLSKVTGFTLRTTEGKSYEFLIGDLVNGKEFPPGHLAEHQATGSPIKVTFHVAGSELVAIRLDDAS